MGSPSETDESDCRPTTFSPFRLFGTAVSAATTTTTMTATTVTTSAIATGNTTPNSSKTLSSSVKKCPSTSEKIPRKRNPKVEDNNDPLKTKRRRNETTNNQKQLTLTELVTPISIERKTPTNMESTNPKVNRSMKIETLKINFAQKQLVYLKANSINYRDASFSPVSSAQSDSCSNSNQTSESSTVSTGNCKLIQVV